MNANVKHYRKDVTQLIKSGGVCADITGTALTDAGLLVSEQTKVVEL